MKNLRQNMEDLMKDVKEIIEQGECFYDYYILKDLQIKLELMKDCSLRIYQENTKESEK